MERGGEAEVVEGGAVIGGELLGFGPSAVDEGKDVDGALGRVAADGRAVGPDDEGVAIDGDGGAEVIEETAIARGELLRLGESAGYVGKHVGRALRDNAIDGRAKGGHEQVAVVERDAITELVTREAVARDELLPFGPDIASFVEDISGAAKACVAIRADNRGGGFDRSGGAEEGVYHAVARSDFLLRKSVGGRLRQDLGRCTRDKAEADCQ
jgi:hypothetical protein